MKKENKKINKYNILFLIILILYSIFVLSEITYDSMDIDEAIYAWKAQKIHEEVQENR